jgi:hypothetical protein
MNVYKCSHTEDMIFYKLATCISWAVFGGTIGGQHRQVSLYVVNYSSLRGPAINYLMSTVIILNQLLHDDLYRNKKMCISIPAHISW